jgi:demethylmenaquinone methyltransferase/2-methoxy-6-polyprenyl-1,4-benzoquinol methylase
VGKAGDNGFLRFRLRQALTERSAAAGPTVARQAPARIAPTAASPARTSGAADVERAMIDYYEARAPEYDDWYLRRGRYARGAVHDAAWNAELDAAGLWLDGLPWNGEIVELAAGTGWWSPLLASRGELSLYDTSSAALDRARERLVAHDLRAHLHVRDAWAEPDRPVDGLFMGFWLSHVPRARLAEFLDLAHRWLVPGGRLAFIDSLPDPASSAADHPEPVDDRSLRRLADGREFTIVKVFYTADELTAALRAAGFDAVEITRTGRFFVLGTARA